MKTKFMKIIIMLLASLIVVILSLFQDYSLERLSYTLLIVVVLFYIIGTVIQSIIDKTLKDTNKDMDTTSTEELKLQEEIKDIDKSEQPVTEQKNVENELEEDE
ncbi:MAG: hypothetical protein CVV02_14085 [Firmicutes bacterium HGW-Firmicutes-7]|nr:MAG: hypothetical protein CVV02_14085 [Firmicutes bacterium HGW-Firmicutes-7]